jgi:hypothetical protein
MQVFHLRHHRSKQRYSGYDDAQKENSMLISNLEEYTSDLRQDLSKGKSDHSDGYAD